MRAHPPDDQRGGHLPERIHAAFPATTGTCPSACRIAALCCKRGTNGLASDRIRRRSPSDGWPPMPPRTHAQTVFVSFELRNAGGEEGHDGNDDSPGGSGVPAA